MHERPDGSGRHVLSFSGTAAYTGDEHPSLRSLLCRRLSTIRGFAFRDASPLAFGASTPNGAVVGGDFELLASAEYMFPITADDMLRAVVFCDTGTVEPTIKDWNNKYRVAPASACESRSGHGPRPVGLRLRLPCLLESRRPLRDVQLLRRLRTVKRSGFGVQNSGGNKILNLNPDH